MVGDIITHNATVLMIIFIFIFPYILILKIAINITKVSNKWK